MESGVNLLYPRRHRGEHDQCPLRAPVMHRDSEGCLELYRTAGFQCIKAFPVLCALDVCVGRVPDSGIMAAHHIVIWKHIAKLCSKVVSFFLGAVAYCRLRHVMSCHMLPELDGSLRPCKSQAQLSDGHGAVTSALNPRNTYIALLCTLYSESCFPLGSGYLGSRTG